MAKKTRLYTLAKEAGLQSKDFLAKCEKSGLKFKSTLVTVDDSTVAKIRSALGGGGGRSAPKKKKKSASASATEGAAKKAPAKKKTAAKKKSAKKKTSKVDKVKKAVKADPSLIGGYRPVKIEAPAPAPKEEPKAEEASKDKGKTKTKAKDKDKDKDKKARKGPRPSPAAKDAPAVTPSGTPRRGGARPAAGARPAKPQKKGPKPARPVIAYRAGSTPVYRGTTLGGVRVEDARRRQRSESGSRPPRREGASGPRPAYRAGDRGGYGSNRPAYRAGGDRPGAYRASRGPYQGDRAGGFRPGSSDRRPGFRSGGPPSRGAYRASGPGAYRSGGAGAFRSGGPGRGPGGPGRGPGGPGRGGPRPGGGGFRSGGAPSTGTTPPAHHRRDDSGGRRAPAKGDKRRTGATTPYDRSSRRLTLGSDGGVPAFRPRLSTRGRRPARRGGRGGGGRKLKYKLQKKERLEARMAREAALNEANVLFLSDAVSVADLAAMMGQQPTDLIKKLMEMGTMASINQPIDVETAQLLATEYDFEVRNPEDDEEGFDGEGDYEDDEEAAEAAEATEAAKAAKKAEVDENAVLRPPVITVMGHVDHGKTSILDRIRKANVADGEAGGITQHIGAYQVLTESGTRLTFIDTPGHEAFTAMRAQGAQVTDLTVLVVAADDGVMPQTQEAIHHAKAAGCPILVAMNKIDLPGKDEQKCFQGLANAGLVPEAWGGDTVVVGVSAKTGEGFDDLLDMIALQTDMLELKANPDGPPEGIVLEARMEKGLGGVATVLIQKGSLKKGDSFIAGTSIGRVRLLKNWDGETVTEVGPGTPVEVIGWQDVPDVNSQFQHCESDSAARSLLEERLHRRKNQVADGSQKKPTNLESLFANLGQEEKKDLNFVIKADVHGSSIAVADSLQKLTNEEVNVNVVHSGVGAPSESDVMLAAASDAIIVGFHVRPPGSIRKLAEKEGVEIRSYKVIYECVEEVEKAIKGLLKPEYKEVVLGNAEIRQVFSVPKIGKVAGCYVTEGKFLRSCEARLLRDGVEIFSGKLGSLRRFKDDVKEVAQGFECGMSLEGYTDLKEGDVIEGFEQQEVAR